MTTSASAAPTRDAVVFGRALPFIILAATLFAFNFSLGISSTIQGNFWVNVLNIRPDQQAIITTVREIPGLLTMALAALTMRLVPSRLASACFAIMAIGYAAYGYAVSLPSILPGVVVASVGFHVWQTLSGAFSLAVTKERDTGRTLGDLQAVGFVAGLLGIALVYVGIGWLGYPIAFAISGVGMLVGGIAIARFPSALVHVSPQRTVVRRQFRLFYALNFLEGCRFQFFQAFGIFLLVQHYQLTVQTIAILFVITAIGNAATSPIAGRFIDQVGERAVMSVGYAGMFFSFLGLALWHDAVAATVLYVVYNLFLITQISINTYLKRIATPGDVRPCLATGVTIMHVPTLLVPILGGTLWNAFGFEVPFLVGALFILGSLLVTQRIPRYPALSAIELVSAT